jgi:predicted DNA-binding ribbon-helix-helix protein
MRRRARAASLSKKRSIVIGGRKTSTHLEDAFWHSFKNVAQYERLSISRLITRIDADRAA